MALQNRRYRQSLLPGSNPFIAFFVVYKGNILATFNRKP